MKFGPRRPPLQPDPEIIRALAELLTETGLTEIEYAIGDHRIRVARDAGGSRPAAVAVSAAPPTALVAAPPPDTAPAPVKDVIPAGTLTAPIVGVAYLSPQPGAVAFVKTGDTVSEGDTLLIIEAMKVMNQIRAPRAGKLTRIFVQDSEPVEYGAPLMLIE